MKKNLVVYTLICVLCMLVACKNEKPWDGKIVIHPNCEIKTDTIAIDSSYLPWCAEISLKGYTKDTLYLSFNLPESISVLYEIEEISISYYRDPDPEQKLCASLFPCWYIKGYETMTNGDKARTKQIADIYRIPDGVWYYPN